MKRRHFLLSAAAVGGALVVGWGAWPVRDRLGRRGALGADERDIQLNGWIKITPGGQVVLAMHRSEMGQGVHTALPMLVAEQLDIGLERLRLEQAGPESLYGNVAMFLGALPFHPDEREPGQETRLVRAGRWFVAKLARELGINVTGGSSSIADAWEVLPLAAATARAQLLGAAALQWRLPVDELRIADGIIEHPSGQRAHFGEFARQAAALTVSARNIRLKPREQWRLIGRQPLRTDVPAKVNGSAVFGLDVRPEGVLFAVVRHCPMLGGSPGRVDVDAALRRPGVLRVVRLPALAGSTAAVAVVARSTWHAMQAARTLDVQWHPPPHDPAVGLLDTQRIEADLEQAARQAQDTAGGLPFHRRGDVDAAEAAAARLLEVVYHAPYLAHATMEPMNCTAQVRDGRVTLWAPTQVPTFAREVAARVAGVAPEAVELHLTLLGGGFGRRLETDYIAQAVRIAMETGGRPVQLVWPREEDFSHDFYRPAGVAVMRAALDASGRPQALRMTVAGDAITPRWIARQRPAWATRWDAPDKTAAEGFFDLPYEVPHQRIAHRATRSGVPIGYWRSVGHSHHAFFTECFIDELAHAAGQDPLAFRLSLLARHPRHAEVLKLAADKAQWDRPLPAGRARGLALHESFGSIVAEVMEISQEAGRPRVHRVVCAIDCGTVVHPGIVAQQMEGGVIFGLSAALYGRVDIRGGEVLQKNFDTARLLSLAETPVIETHIVPSHRPPAGVGEPGTPPAAPALLNAWFALTGQRVRRLPLLAQAPEALSAAPR
ncbi:molybdopterin cofactor-binding domain-containing protein [Caldimonas sp.]|uniref:xanthine dehydrogenase family protein molybdopterin-binding subunit n=1 Tax=Caldimonas sp. TaxID=2838790 RepID=UPI00307F095A